MENIKELTNKEFESLTNEQKIEYLTKLRIKYENQKKTTKTNIGQKLISKIYPLLRNYDFEIIGEKNIPMDENALFVCNHSNSHDIFTAYEIMEKIKRTATVMVAEDCLSLPVVSLFKASDASLLDRRDKTSSINGMHLMCKKLIEGKCGVIFGESTWNLHPYLPMQTIKYGSSKISAITNKKIIPTIFEYVEVPEICTKESELYTKCIIYFGEPITIEPDDDIQKQTIKIQKRMEEMRKELWKKIGIKKEKIEDINQEVYLNHTYIKKFKAFGFTYDTESESRFLYAPKGQKPINEYHIDENGQFVPGITHKR